jgi:hypothetical protein
MGRGYTGGRRGDASEEPIGILRARKTLKGVRLDVRAYIYPDGHGQIGAAYMVANAQGAAEVFRRLWEEAQRGELDDLG